MPTKMNKIGCLKYSFHKVTDLAISIQKAIKELDSDSEDTLYPNKTIMDVVELMEELKILTNDIKLVYDTNNKTVYTNCEICDKLMKKTIDTKRLCLDCIKKYNYDLEKLR